MKKLLLACFAFGACLLAQGPAPTAANGGYSIFNGTMVDMTYSRHRAGGEGSRW